MSHSSFQLTPANTLAAVIVRNDESKLLSKLGHDHVIRANDFAVDVSIPHDDDLSDLHLELSFDVASLIVDADVDRSRVGLSGTVAPRDQKATRDNMLARGQLHAQKYPRIHFAARGARPGQTPERWLLNAEMTIAGTTHAFVFPLTINHDHRFALKGTATLSHRDFGLTPYKAPLGALRNRDELTFVVDIHIE